MVGDFLMSGFLPLISLILPLVQKAEIFQKRLAIIVSEVKKRREYHVSSNAKSDKSLWRQGGRQWSESGN
ncbi:hypothetical protein DHL47_05860 [Streptococcus panodentis]|uniref:Uncharacterized protein n=1 Tax=Streptococcus panodentis TaxID=1581472 RepID=A0ABS5AX98_9STRE|nr:hypothetical protein [Streptococcus panodentis]